MKHSPIPHDPIKGIVAPHVAQNQRHGRAQTRAQAPNRLRRRLIRWAVLPVGGFIFLIGLILFPLPIPFGLIFMTLGVCIAAFNPLAARAVKRMRRRFPTANAKLIAITPRLPAFLRRILNRTA